MRTAGDACSENSDDDAIHEPLREEFPQAWRATGPDCDEPNRAALELLLHLRRFHFLHRAIRKNVNSAGCDSCAAQRVSNFVLIGKSAVVAFVKRKDHMQDRTGDENNYSGKQNRQPQRGDGDHRSSLI